MHDENLMAWCNKYSSEGTYRNGLRLKRRETTAGNKLTKKKVEEMVCHCQMIDSFHQFNDSQLHLLTVNIHPSLLKLKLTK